MLITLKLPILRPTPNFPPQEEKGKKIKSDVPLWNVFSIGGTNMRTLASRFWVEADIFGPFKNISKWTVCRVQISATGICLFSKESTGGKLKSVVSVSCFLCRTTKSSQDRFSITHCIACSVFKFSAGNLWRCREMPLYHTYSNLTSHKNKRLIDWVVWIYNTNLECTEHLESLGLFLIALVPSNPRGPEIYASMFIPS